MAAGDVKQVYAASVALTVTNLHSLPASATYIAGWESGAIDNTANLYLDYRITAKLVTHASNRQAGELQLALIGPTDDSNWPDVLDGTESVETFTDTEERDAVCILAGAVTVDNSASAVYEIHVPSVRQVFGGNLPKKFVIYITGNASTGTTAQLAASGSVVTVTGSYLNVA